MNRTPILSAMIGSVATDEPAIHLVRKTMGSNPIRSFLFSFVGRLMTSAFAIALSFSELFYSAQSRSAYLFLIGCLILALGIATLVDEFVRRGRRKSRGSAK